MKPSASKIGRDGFTTDTVTCLFSNTGFTRETDQSHHDHRQSHNRYRVLNLEVLSLPGTGNTMPNVAWKASVGGDEAPTADRRAKSVTAPWFVFAAPDYPKGRSVGCPQIVLAPAEAFYGQAKRSVPKLGGRYTLAPGNTMGRGLQISALRGLS